VLVAGCANSGSGGGDPGAIAMPAGSTCQSVRAELNKLDAKGTPSKIEAIQAGKPVPAAAKADADRYNYLLNLYLGARCHV
jgi:hypothetical protein